MNTTRKRGEDVTLFVATIVLLIVGFLPWSDDGSFRNESISGYNGPMGGLATLGVFSAVVLSIDVAIARFFGQSPIAYVNDAIAPIVRVTLGCITLACVFFVYLRVMDDAMRNVFIALAAAAVIAYHGYLLYWDATSATDKGPKADD